MKTKHQVFDPNPLYGTPLQIICDNMQEDGWTLSHIVSVSEYQSVAIFLRPDPEIDHEEEEVGYL